MTKTDEMTRRDFCSQAGHFVSLFAIGSIAQGCGGPTSPSDSAPSLPAVAGSIVNGALVLQIGADSPLASVGGAARVSTAAGTFLIARTATDAFTAVTAVCTHQQCLVNGFTNQVYVCPCHGSRFNTSGGVVNGPASSPLRQFPTQFLNDVLTVTI
jgi:cytochrome b6-f complex iron-sulfur subunit